MDKITHVEALQEGVDLDGIRAYVADLGVEGLRSFAEAAAYELVRARRMLREERAKPELGRTESEEVGLCESPWNHDLCDHG